MAFQLYEHEDMLGLVTDEHVLLRTLKVKCTLQNNPPDGRREGSWNNIVQYKYGRWKRVGWEVGVGGGKYVGKR